MPWRLISSGMLIFVLSGVIGACSQEKYPHSDSSVAGGIGKAYETLKVPRRLPDSGQELISLNLAKNMLASRASGGLSSLGRGSSRDQLASVYTQACEDAGGIPRSQGEEILNALVKESSKACAGVSCSKVFDIASNEVDSFFDRTLVKAATNPPLFAADNLRFRTSVLASLAQEGAFSKRPQSNQDLIARIYLERPGMYPETAKAPTSLITRPMVRKDVGERFNKAVGQFTYNAFEQMRRVETWTKEDLLRSGMTDDEIHHWKFHIDVINEGLKAFPILRQTVYRGLQGISPEQLAYYVAQWLDKKPVALGPNNKPALTSTSWNPSIAASFVYDERGQRKSTNGYGIFFIIDGHRGVGIENLSRHYQEGEVLLPTQSWFRIESITPVFFEDDVVMIKLRGVDDVGI